MKHNKLLLLIIPLLLYSITIMLLEFQFGQDYVRLYLTDIIGPVRFYAINTTASVSLEWGSALLFFITLLLIDDRKKRQNEYYFYSSQVILFIYLGIDDRFRIHEYIGSKLHFQDAYYLFGIGVIELFVLYFLADLPRRPRKTTIYLGRC